MSLFVAGSGVWLRVPLAPQSTEEVLVDGFHVELQGQNNWCWAAVGSAVARHYDPATRFARQCDVANEHLKRTLPTPEAQAAAGEGQCCGSGRHGCNLVAALDQVLITLGRFGPVKAGPLAFDDLWEELPGLLCARIEHGERGHFVAIAGASRHGSRKQVLVADPAVDGAFWCPYGVFRDSYLGDGVWTTTYWTE